MEMAAYDKIRTLLAVIEEVQRVHIPFLRPIQNLALKELEPHAKQCQEELDKLNEAEAAEQAKKAEAQKKEADEIAKKEEAANQASVRRDLPPLASPPAR
jgi:hypothetical protein